jgi:hypothetical protein
MAQVCRALFAFDTLVNKIRESPTSCLPARERWKAKHAGAR